MTYLFGERTSPHLTPAPTFILDADERRFSVTHVKSGILYDAVPLDYIRQNCREQFEGILQTILQSVHHSLPIVDCNAVIELTDAALAVISKVAIKNIKYQNPGRFIA